MKDKYLIHILLQKKTFIWASIEKDDERNELISIMKKYSSDKIKTIKNIRIFIDKLGIKEKANDFIMKNINTANDILDTLSGDVSLLKHFSDLVLNRNK